MDTYIHTYIHTSKAYLVAAESSGAGDFDRARAGSSTDKKAAAVTVALLLT